MSKRLRVAVLMGGSSAEREVSLSSGRQVLQALDPARYEAISVDPARLEIGEGAENGLLALARSERPDLAFICLHGRHGEDGTVQGLLELLGIPYTGSGVLASALAIDKAMSKRIFAANGIPTPAWTLLHGRAEVEAYLASPPAAPWPVVVKPSHEGSTIGISVVREPENLAAALQTALVYDDEILVEQFVEGIEITAPVLGNDRPSCLPLVEIVPRGGFYDYEAKYTPGATEEIVPARIPAEREREARELALRAHTALGCRGISRTDMLVSADGVTVLELNTIPGMTPTSLVPRAADAAGIPFAELVDRLIHLALEGRSCEPTTASRP